MAMGAAGAGAHTTFFIDTNTVAFDMGMRHVYAEAIITFNGVQMGAIKAGKAIEKTAEELSILAVAGSTAKTALLAMGAALAAGGVAFAFTTKAVMNFDTTIRRAAAVGRLTAAETETLTNEVNRLAMTYGIAGDQIAAGAVELVKAGVGADELFEALEVITQATLDTTIEFTTAAELYVQTTRAFAKEGMTAAQVFDMMRAAANAAIIDVAEFSQVLQTSAAMFSLLGLTSEQLFALSAALTQVGIRNRIAATGLRQLLVNLVENSDAVQAFADRLGVTVQIIENGQLNLLDFILAMQGVEVTIEDVQEAFGFLDTRAANALFGLINAGPEVVRIMDAIGESTGQTAEFATAMGLSLQFLWGRVIETIMSEIRTPEFLERLGNAMGMLAEAAKAIGPEIGDLLIGLIESFVANLPTLITFLTTTLRLLNELAPVFSALASGMGIVLEIVNALGGAGTIFAIAILMMARSLFALELQTWKNVAAAFALKMGLMGFVLFMSDAPMHIRLLGVALMGLTAIYWGLATAIAAAAASKTMGAAAIPTMASWASLLAAAGVIAGTAIVLATPEGFQRGTEFLPEDTLAFLHRGERVVNAEENRYFTGGIHGGSVTVNVYDTSAREIDEILLRWNR